MTCQIFKLDKYFYETQFYFYFFDGLFSYEIEDKQLILNKLMIIGSSHRTQRNKANTKKNNVELLLEYFKYNDIKEEEKLSLEILLSQIYYFCYYKQKEKLIDKLELLNVEINKHNVLKPILILFRVLINMNLEYDTINLNNVVKEDIEYLKLFFKKKYFMDELEFLYLIILYNFDHYDEEVLNKLNNLSLLYKRLSWLYFFVKGSKAYINKENVSALTNFTYLLEEFKNKNNLERYFMVVNNVSCLYNLLGEYHLSHNISSEAIEYVFSDIKKDNRLQNILMHYVFSNLMLERYDEIIEFINIIIFDKSYLNPLSTVICLIAVVKVDKLDQFSYLLSMNFDNENYKIIVEYFKTKDKSVLNNLTKYPYYKKIKDILLA